MISANLQKKQQRLSAGFVGKFGIHACSIALPDTIILYVDPSTRRQIPIHAIRLMAKPFKVTLTLLPAATASALTGSHE